MTSLTANGNEGTLIGMNRPRLGTTNIVNASKKPSVQEIKTDSFFGQVQGVTKTDHITGFAGDPNNNAKTYWICFYDNDLPYK